MIEVPLIHEARLQNYLLVITEPLRKESLSLEQIASFCKWFDNLILLDAYGKEPDKVAMVARKPIAVLASYDKHLATIVLNRNKWVGNVSKTLPEVNEDLVKLLHVMADDLGYSGEKLVDFIDALVRLIAAAGNQQRVPGLVNYLDKPLAYRISGDR